MSVQKSGWEASKQSPVTLGCPSPSFKDRRVDCVLIVDAGCPWFIVNPNYDSCDQSIFSLQGHLSCPGQQRGKRAPVGSCQLSSRLAKIPHQEPGLCNKKLERGGTWACRSLPQTQTDHGVLTYSQNTPIHTYVTCQSWEGPQRPSHPNLSFHR